jgi:hypothetical protein
VPHGRKVTLSFCSRISPEVSALRDELQRKLDVRTHELIERSFLALKAQLEQREEPRR